MDVTEIVKKSLAFSLGVASFSAERLKQFAQDMVERGEMSSEEARSFVDEVSDRAEQEKRSIETWVSEQVSKMLRQAGAAEAERVNRLETRVAALEKLVAELGGDAAACGETASEGKSAG